TVLLRCRRHEQEAKIVARAGRAGRVTIATNMAGRGTDIKPSPEVVAAGGLHVLGTERHEAKRIDRQLIGRAGRQGDPGSGQFFVALDDELLESLGHARAESIGETGKRGGARDWSAFRPLYVKAQKRMERKHFRQRLTLILHTKFRHELLAALGADPLVD